MQDSIYHMTLAGSAVAQPVVFFSFGLHWVLTLISTRRLYCFIIEPKSVCRLSVCPYPHIDTCGLLWNSLLHIKGAYKLKMRFIPLKLKGTCQVLWLFFLTYFYPARIFPWARPYVRSSRFLHMLPLLNKTVPPGLPYISHDEEGNEQSFMWPWLQGHTKVYLLLNRWALQLQSLQV